ncbi:hypothetical protein QZH46_03810 [Pseudomonas corrugata]
MLIGHRFERTAQDDLRIHSHNRVQSIAVLLVGALAFLLPVTFAVFAVADGLSPSAGLDPLSSLLIVLGLLLIPALGLMLMVYTGIRESLVLSRVDGKGRRLTRNFLDVASVCSRYSESMPSSTLRFVVFRRLSKPEPSCGW